MGESFFILFFRLKVFYSISLGWSIVMKNFGSVLLLQSLMIILLFSPVSGSSDWVEYFKDSDGSVYSHQKEIIRENGLIQVWDKEVFSKKGKEKYIQELRNREWSIKGYDKLLYKHVLSEIDCKKKRIRMLLITEHDENGKELFSYSFEDPEWEPIIPYSNWDVLRKKLCK